MNFNQDIVFSGNKLACQDCLGCALTRDLSKRRYPDSPEIMELYRWIQVVRVEGGSYEWVSCLKDNQLVIWVNPVILGEMILRLFMRIIVWISKRDSMTSVDL